MSRDHGLDFTVLASVPQTGGLRVYPLPDARTAFGDVLLALDEKGQRTVMVPLQDATAVRADKESAGVRLLKEVWDLGDRPRSYLMIRCTLAHLDDVFALIAREMVDAVLAPDGGPPDARVRDVLLRWRQLLGAPRRELPSREVLQGLWGELWHLRLLATRGVEGAAVWTGWDATAHDFSGVHLHLEVKTVRSRSWRVRITSLDQLHDAPCPLLLSVLRVEVAGTGGTSVPELVRELLDLGVDTARLVTGIQTIGLDWSDLEHEEVQALRFDLRDHRAWWVSHGFPRIIQGSFREGLPPGGVVAVQYDIELAERVDDAVSDEAFGAALDRLQPGSQ